MTILCIDNIILMAETKSEAKNHAEGLVFLLEKLGSG